VKVCCFAVFVLVFVCERGRGGQNRFDNIFMHKFLVHPAGMIDNDMFRCSYCICRNWHRQQKNMTKQMPEGSSSFFVWICRLLKHTDSGQ
jgi:hypothetical protein